MINICKFSDDNYQKMFFEIRRKYIIFFNGCFDLLHRGHFELFNEIKYYSKAYYGDKSVIICGLNSDESYKLQNKSHPLVNDEKTRAENLISLGIDKVIIYDENNAEKVIKSLMPNCYYTTEDYYYKNTDEVLLCKKYSIQIKAFNKIEGISSTDIYKKIANQVKSMIGDMIDGSIEI